MGTFVENRWWRRFILVMAWATFFFIVGDLKAERELIIIQKPDASPLIERAGTELAKYLGNLFNVEAANIDDVSPMPINVQIAVVVGHVGSIPGDKPPRGIDDLRAEGYVIETSKYKGIPAHFICGKDDKGALNGAYGFIELLYNKLLGYESPDIDFEVQRGSAKLEALADLKLSETSAPFYPWRGVYLHNLELGVADLLKLPEGLGESADIWKKWVDWISRHKGNYVVTWPYNSGFNWWEYVIPQSDLLKGLVPYSQEQIAGAIAIRHKLFEYANDRGVRVFIGSYIPGGANEEYIQKVLTERGLCGRGPLKFSMCLSQPGTLALYSAIVKEIHHTYPEIAGLHYRWWAESGGCFCKECEAERRRANEAWPTMKKWLRGLVDVAVEAAPEKTVIISGFRRASGDVDYAHAMPKNVVFECKWGWGGSQGSSFFNAGSDWEPTPYHGVPEDWIEAMGRPLLIDHRLTTECSVPIGVDQSWQLKAGISDTAAKADRLPAVQGFPLIVNERDQEWVVGIQFHTMFKLNWEPSADVDKLVHDHFKNHYSTEGAKNLTEALRLDGASWSHYVVEMIWMSKYRFSGWNFDVDLFWALPPSYRERTIKDLQGLKDDLQRALVLCDQAYLSARPDSYERFWDFRHQLAVHYHYYAGTLGVMKAFERLRANDQRGYQRLLKQVMEHYRELLVNYDEKQNRSFGNEFDENVTVDSAESGRPNVVEAISMIEQMLEGTKTFSVPSPLPINERLGISRAPEKIEYQGKSCYHLASESPNDRLMLAVRREHAYFVDRDFRLEIEYYDSGKAGDIIQIEYDSHLGGPLKDMGNPYTPVEFKKSGKKGWNKTEVMLKRCRFLDLQSDQCDITITSGGDEGEYIASVRLLEIGE